MSLLITRPDYEPATKYLCAWSQKIMDEATSRNHDVFDLLGKNANRRELTSRMLKLDPKLLVLNGHGDDDRIAGQDDEILIKVGENDNLLHARITYAVSCRCGRKLGQKVAQIKDTAFIGYNDDFVFSSDRRYMSRPLEDKRAKPFMQASNQVGISLLKGHTAQESSERSKQMFEAHYQSLLSSDNGPDGLQDARFLWWNMKHQVCLGKSKSKTSGQLNMLSNI